MGRFYFDVTVRLSGVVEAADEQAARAAWREQITIDAAHHHEQLELEIIEREKTVEG